MLLASVAALAHPAAAADPTRVVGFSQSRPIPTAESVSEHLGRLHRSVCQRRPQQVGGVNLKHAIDRAWRYLRQRESPRALKRFKQSRFSQSAALAREGAVAALLEGRPGGVLAALLAAHEEQPRKARHLVNAAGVMASLGLGREAIAVLNGVHRYPAFAPMGIKTKAIGLSNRGLALITLGRFSAAAQVLKRAVQLDPQLQEAHLNRGVAQRCAGNRQAAVRTMRLGSWRPPTPAQTFSESDLTLGRLPAAEVIDMSRGQTAEIPDFYIPPSTETHNRAQDQISALYQAVDARSVAKEDQYDELSLSDTPPLRPIEERRLLDLRALYPGPFDSQQALGARKEELWQELFDAQERATADGACKNHEGQYQEWLYYYHQYVSVVRSFAAAQYRHQTAVAANIRQPVWHRMDVLWAEHRFLSHYSDLLWRLAEAPAYNCEEIEPDDPNVSPDDVPDPDDPGRCSAGPSFALKAGWVSASVTCESVEIEASTPGWVGGFVQGKLEFSSLHHTAFVGLKAGAPFGPSAKTGVYLTVDRNGQMVDVGWRVSGGVRGSIGSLSIRTGSRSADVSFAPAFAPAN